MSGFAYDGDSGSIKGGTDGAAIGNIGDRLKVEALSSIGGTGAGISFGDRDTSATTQVAVERTTYTEQTTGAQRSIASSSANDAAAGTGARTVLLTYLTSTGSGPFTETITLNGTSYVNTVATDICFIESIVVKTVGSTGSNVGTLTLKAATGGGGATIWTVGATSNRTFAARHYVPTGKTALITGISCAHNGTTVGSGAAFIIFSRNLSMADAAREQASGNIRLYGQSSTFSRVFQSPIKVAGPAVVFVLCTPETTSSINYRCAVDYSEQT
jgi:hypothetical protein